MSDTTTYTQARASLAELCSRVAETGEPVIITRRGADDVALISAAELASLMETAHLLRSPENARRLLSALSRARGRKVRPMKISELRRKVGLEKG